MRASGPTAAAVSRAEVELRLRALDEEEKADQELRHQILLRLLKRDRDRRSLELQLETAL